MQQQSGEGQGGRQPPFLSSHALTCVVCDTPAARTLCKRMILLLQLQYSTAQQRSLVLTRHWTRGNDQYKTKKLIQCWILQWPW